MSNQQNPQHGYWRSLAEVEAPLASQDHIYDQMSQEAASGSSPQDLFSRRNFFQLMGASMALAGVAGAGCKRYEKDHIAPLPRRPEDQIPGEAIQYSTMMELGGAAQALVASSYEGRPIKLDGNPDHPFAGGGVLPGTKRHGGSTAFAQASVLHLYDPDRSQRVLQGSKSTTLEAFQVWLDGARAQLAAEPGSVAVLSEATSSPTIARLRAQLPNLAWYEWEPVSWDNERAGTKLAFGRPLRPLAKLDRAETILTLDCDLFSEHPASLRYSRDYGKSRRLNGSLGGDKMNRLWSVESVFTGAGAVADHRLPLRSELILPLAMALDAQLNGGAAPSSEFLREAKVAKFLEVLVEELRENTGRAVVVAGARQPAEVHALVARINDKLGAVGSTLEYLEDADPGRPSHLQAITELSRKMESGAVKTLFILGGNPVYDAPWDVDFEVALAKVQTSIHLAEYVNETSAKTTWHIPRAHYLEAWGDARTWDGTLTVAQPLLSPLYGGISPAELLALVAGQEATGLTLLKDTHKGLGVTASWEQTVHDGFVPGPPPAAPLTPALVAFGVPTLSPSQLSGSRRKNGELEVVFAASSQTYDGRFANNAWLQETPDFFTKVTWDNYALVSPATASDLGLENDTLIQVKVGERAIDVACYVMPGQAKYSIGLVLGGGRTRAGVVGGDGKKQVGFNTYKVRGVNGFDIATACSVSKGGEEFVLANVQEHWDIRGKFPGFKDLAQTAIAERLPSIVREEDRALVVKDKAWKAQPTMPYHDEADRGLALYQEHVYNGHRWGMSIDLGNCTGCNSCMVACQAENNVPVVGKDQVIRNREMHWIRIDRYFKGSPDDPEIVHQPLACQQCENAPCEQVCPVGATVHSDEGLNDMAYNRCVGTRYCANNCPYKVRRFNFLDYHKEFSEARNRVRKLLFNPDVTVRSRGVMEKCTFCVQRIQNVKIRHKAQVRSGQIAAETLPVSAASANQEHVEYKIPDGEIVTACQAACPTEAIIFGDLADPDSRVSQLHADRRSYDLLEELYTKPRNRYMARIRNPNPKLVAAAPAPSHEGGH
jgi:Fe-S-cluster-containing dehydrogenase component